ncbi:MAG: hypothetical protein HY554_12685 [Elusimicrobia bacterium]|nr:hypothetical protein [Elusimicrobiota bacterium]
MIPLLCAFVLLLTGPASAAQAARKTSRKLPRPTVLEKEKPAKAPPAPAAAPEEDEEETGLLVDDLVVPDDDAPEEQPSEVASPPGSTPEAAAQPAAEPAWPTARGYAWLEQAVGAETLRLLADGGYLVVHRLRKTGHLVHVQWELLEPLVRLAPQLLDSFAALENQREGRDDAEPKEDALKAALGHPPAGLVTARVRSALSLLLDLIDERRGAGSAPLPERPLALQPWAADFSHRYNLAQAQDAAPLVEPFFSELLSGAGRAPAAEEHLRAHAQSRYGADIGPLLEADVRSGQLSDELRGWVEKYLSDNRRAWRLLQLPADLAALLKDRKLQRELEDLRQSARALAADPTFLQGLRESLAPGALPPETARVTGGEVHVHTGPEGQGYEAGDRASISAAYWLDEVPRGRSARVQETVFADRGPHGIELLHSSQRSRGSGGPHAVAADAELREGRPFVVRFIAQPEGGRPVHREAAVSPAGALDAALAKLGRADAAFASCKLAEAAAAYEALSQELGERSRRPQFARLAAELRPRQKRAALAQEDHAALDGLLEGVRLDASPQTCAFSEARGLKARALLSRLPAGCSRELAPEINQLLTAAVQRRRDQDTFWAGLEGARRLERACQFPQAAERYAAALAVLDADPSAKCGRAQEEYRRVHELELPAALAADGVRSGFHAELDAASESLGAGDPARALAKTNPLLARLAALRSPGCYETERRKGEELALTAEAGLQSPAQALARVPDPMDGTFAAVARERARLDAESHARRQREVAQQAPAALPAPAEEIALEELPGVNPLPGQAVAPDIQADDVAAAEPPPKSPPKVLERAAPQPPKKKRVKRTARKGRQP